MPASFVRRVEDCISKIVREFRRNPELFLTESDLKCRLFMELDSDPVLSKEESTQDGRKTNYVHSESSYFVFGRLNKKRVDITVVNPSNFDFRNQAASRKGYYFAEPSIGIELKLNKVKSKNGMKKELITVFSDLSNLKGTRPESSFYLLLLDKRGVFSREDIDEFRDDYPEIPFFYECMVKTITPEQAS